MSHHASIGSVWHQWDLHFHTPSSFDYQDKSITNQQLVDGLIDAGVRVVSVTDHHLMDVPRIRDLQSRGGTRLTVLPGIELRSDQGGHPIHYICIFSENCDLDHVWTTLQGKLGLTPKGVSDKGGDDKVYVPIEDGASIARELGGIVSIHAGEKSNSIESIKNREQFQQRIKLDITDRWVDLMEIGQLKDIDVHMNTIFPAIGLERPLVLCSDNHNIKEYTRKVPLWLKADPNFRGLLMTLREPLDRVFVGIRPPDLIRQEQNPTKRITSITYSRKDTAPADEKWFAGMIEFNPGLVAITGNKGSGKSALADTIGLLGGSRNTQSFSFLNGRRFNHDVNGRGQHYEAKMTWGSGSPVSKPLSGMVGPEELERVKYLPQDHVESICNEFSALGARAFEEELKTVIFSHVTEKLSQRSLDDLVRFRSDEKQKRVDSLMKELREISRSRCAHEAEADPLNKTKYQELLKQREIELAAYDTARPAAVPKPAEQGEALPENRPILDELATGVATETKLTTDIAAAEKQVESFERRLAVANKLLEKLDNFEKEFAAFAASLRDEAEELGIDAAAIVSLNIDRTTPSAISKETQNLLSSLRRRLDAKRNPQSTEAPGLRQQLVEIRAALTSIRARLDEPNRAYQSYLGALAKWQEGRDSIVGPESNPESISGLNASLKNLETLPDLIRAARKRQLSLAREIHKEKMAQVAIHKSLYGAVQTFIDSHRLAKEKLRLEFRAELVCEGFAERFSGLLDLGRRGTFRGVDESRDRIDSALRSAKWSDEESVAAFVDSIDNALHADLREATPPATQLKDQVRSHRGEEVLDLLYSLEYLQPRYVLRWEGKDLSMLSPGERGTLLLAFYLLIDKGDGPLVIDQPEGNLDNHTVAKVLVDCIKEARKRRQIFIVTHNPNLAVVCDADQVVHASINKEDGNLVTYQSGALENPEVCSRLTDVLEGTLWAFGVRDLKYRVGA